MKLLKSQWSSLSDFHQASDVLVTESVVQHKVVNNLPEKRPLLDSLFTSNLCKMCCVPQCHFYISISHFLLLPQLFLSVLKDPNSALMHYASKKFVFEKILVLPFYFSIKNELKLWTFFFKDVPTFLVNTFLYFPHCVAFQLHFICK